MSNFTASVPIANMHTANATLEAAGFGPGNFSVPAYVGSAPAFAMLHAWGDAVFEAAVAAIPNVTITQGTDPIAMTASAAESNGAKWAANAPPLPTEGVLVANDLYRFEGNLWFVIQGFDRGVFSAHPDTYQALICRIGEPGVVCDWWQPIYSFDAPKLVNQFTGKPDRRMHNGSTWEVTQADGTGNNVWEPGVFGWMQV